VQEKSNNFGVRILLNPGDKSSKYFDMKKIISIISTIITILAGIVFMNSCRQQDDDQTFDQSNLLREPISRMSNKYSDTLLQSSNFNEFDESGIDYKDPPPKNGGQWKIKK
jgi:hypothetical protein